jgi:hypothetical protein
MKTKLLKKFAILSLGLMGLVLIGNNVFAVETSLDDQPKVKCDLCVVQDVGGKLNFSCRASDGDSCSYTNWTGTTTSCNNAKKC